jgi:hypothetical protein
MSILPLAIIMVTNPPEIIIVCVIASVVFGLIGACWMPYLITKNHLRPAIDKCGHNETTWLRITKDRIVLPQFADKGPYGQTKGVTFREKADVMDDGAFPIRWLNGNPGIIMYDMMNTNVDLNKSVARKLMKQEHGIRSGIEGYHKAKQDKKVMFDE